MQSEARDVVVAEDVRRRVFEGLGPLVAGAMERLAPNHRVLVEGAAAPCVLQAIVQAHPPIVRLLMVGARATVEIERVPGAVAPELVTAAEDVLAGFLAALNPAVAAGVVAKAAELRKAGRGGGLLLLVDYSDHEVSAVLNVNPKDLSESVVLGTIADATPAREH